MKRRTFIVASLAGVGMVGYSALTLSQVVNLNDAINKGGRQRMLSQRMASHYLAASWNVQAQSAKVEMLKARDEFLTAHDILVKAPENTERIAQELVLAEQQFVFFQAALQNLHIGSAEKRPMLEVFQTSERILQAMDDITNLYSRIS